MLAAAPAAAQEGARGPLDGMAFAGRFGAEGKPADSTDALYFGDGRFWSRNCVPCGFTPGVYWVRRSGDGLHFRGTMESAEAGRFTYTGVVENGEIRVHINWRKDRWYWTIDRDFWFEGHLAEDPAVPPAASVRRRALANEPAPTCDPRS